LAHGHSDVYRDLSGHHRGDLAFLRFNYVELPPECFNNVVNIVTAHARTPRARPEENVLAHLLQHGRVLRFDRHCGIGFAVARAMPFLFKPHGKLICLQQLIDVHVAVNLVADVCNLLGIRIEP